VNVEEGCGAWVGGRGGEQGSVCQGTTLTKESSSSKKSTQGAAARARANKVRTVEVQVEILKANFETSFFT
jgi:hypothetical protein